MNLNFGRDRYIFTVTAKGVSAYKSSTLDESIIPRCDDGQGSMSNNLGCAYKYLYNE